MTENMIRLAARPASKVAKPDRSRQIARISGDYLFRTLTLMVEAHDGSMTAAALYFAIANANTAHLDESALGAAYASIDNPPPDELRRPVSILSLAQMLGMPFETARRHVNKLIAAGRCARVPGGVIVPQADADSEAMRQVMQANARHVRRLVRALRRAGIDID